MAKRFRSGTFLGVDIGSARIKAVEIGRGGGGLTVRAAGSVATPSGAVQEGKITDPQAVGRALREVLATAGIRTRHAVASVNGQVAIVREVRMPKLPPAEVKAAARFEVERYLPYPIAEVTYDTFVVGEFKDNGNTRLDVLVAAARTDVLTQHVTALRAAGLEPEILDVEPFALARAMTVGGKQAQSKILIYIHIGAENTGIVIADGQVPRVMRTVAFGGNTVTKLLAERLGVEFAQAESLKLKLGSGQQEGAPVPDPRQLEEVMISSLGDLTTEVRRSLDYYEGRNRGAGPEGALVTGGGALLPGLTKYLATDLGVPVEVGDPFQSVGGLPRAKGGDAAQAGTMMAVAVGLARRGVEEP